MQFAIVLAVLLVLSIALAERALRQVIHLEKLGKVKKALSQGKILFKTDHSSLEERSS